jgi:hypothetical protein
MKKLFRTAFAFVAALALAGCSTDDETNHAKSYPAIHIEPSDAYRGGSREIEMPESGLRFNIIGRPVVPEGNFMATGVFEVGPNDLRRNALLVQVDAKAAGELYALSGKANGKRLFLLVGDRPVGVHLIDSTVRDGDVFFDVEMPGATRLEKDKALFKLSADLNEAILKIRKEKAEK